MCSFSPPKTPRMSKDRSSRLLKGLQDYLSVQFVPREVVPGWTALEIPDMVSIRF